VVATTKPYVYATWLAPFLTDDKSCEWSVWFRAHNGARSDSSFDLAKFKMEHTPLLAKARAELGGLGYTVFSEDQNAFKLVGKSGTTLGGKPDLIAVSGERGIVADVKTGRQYDYHLAQVALYMWAVPLYFKPWANIKFEGRVIYKAQAEPVPASAVDDAFIAKLGGLVNRVAAEEEALRVPSARECRLCP
jgi:hypothetical protein